MQAMRTASDAEGPLLIDDFDCMMIDRMAERLMAANNYANHASGHRYNQYRDRKGVPKRRAGGGFSFRPEIPFRRAGNGQGVYDGDGVSEDEPGYLYYEDDELAMPRYDRKNHPDQSMPKVDWPHVRHWANYYRRQRAPTTSDSENARAQMDKLRKAIDADPGLITRMHAHPKRRSAAWKRASATAGDEVEYKLVFFRPPDY
jgi:hypothetical protein